MSHIFGYVFVGGSPIETVFLKKSLAFNAGVISGITNSDWHSDDIRIQDTDDLRSAQTIAIAKFYNGRNRQALMDDLFTVLKHMHWSDGFVVDRSVDRTLVGEPLAYEYELHADNFCITRIQPVGESIRCEELVRNGDT